jgi:uncharacterized membrane protein
LMRSGSCCALSSNCQLQEKPMDRYFLTDDPIERGRSERRGASSPRMEFVAQLFQGSPSRSDRPLHPRLIGLGSTLLIAASATDLVYVNTLLFQWENFSIWLITGGLLLAALASLALIFDVASRRIAGIDWRRFSGFAAAVLLSLLNALVHSRDAYTAVAPQGLELSALVAAILVIIGWRGWNVRSRHTFGPIISKEFHP